MPRFSVVLIARNEESTLPRLLDSLKGFQDRGGEICLLDTGSTDSTAELARNRGCVVLEAGDRFRRPIDRVLARRINKRFRRANDADIVTEGDSLFDYAAARNYAAQMASNDMIATPDCDEAYTALDLDLIDAAIERGVEQLEYNFVFSHDEFGNEAIKFLHSKFYDRRKAKWDGIIHEVLQGDVRREFFPENVIKLEHWQNAETDRTGYLKGLALDCYLNPEKDRQSHYFGRELLWTGRPYSAIDELERHVAMKAWPAERAQSIIYMGDAYVAIGDTDLGLGLYARAYIVDGTRREALMRLATHFYKHNEPQRAAAYAAAALEVREGTFYANDRADYTFRPHEILYWAKWLLGDREGSVAHFDKALAYMPDEPKFLEAYAVAHPLPTVTFLLPTMGTRPEGLERCLASIENLIYPKELVETIVLMDEPRRGVPARIKEGLAKASGQYIALASDDVEFSPASLINAMRVMLESTNQVGLVGFNTGPLTPDRGNICEHFLVNRKYLPLTTGGEIFDLEFHHVGADNLLFRQFDIRGLFQRAERAHVKHYHFSQTGKPMDATHQLAWSRVDEDRAILKRKLGELEARLG